MAAGGAEALSHIEKEPDRYDLIVTDFAMPLLFGLNVVRFACNHRPNSPVVMVSGYVDASAIESRPGDVVLLKKPFSPEALIEAIQQALSQDGAPVTRYDVSVRSAATIESLHVRRIEAAVTRSIISEFTMISRVLAGIVPDVGYCSAVRLGGGQDGGGERYRSFAVPNILDRCRPGVHNLLSVVNLLRVAGRRAGRTGQRRSAAGSHTAPGNRHAARSGCGVQS